MSPHIRMVLAGLGWALIVGLALTVRGQIVTPPPPVPATHPAATQPLHLSDVIKPNDRVLFVGDEITQQMFYTRDVAAAVLALMPDAGLRFYNGGKEGATAQSTLKWIDELMKLTEPTVVFVCLGLNDAEAKSPQEQIVQDYRQNLGELVGKIRGRGRAGVRLVVVLGPPAIQTDLSERADAKAVNQTLAALAKAAGEVAADKAAAFGDLYEPMNVVYTQASKLDQALTLGGRLPSEPGHLVLASIILRGMGVTADDLNKVGWMPLLPRKAAPFRWALALPLKTPADMDKADRSRDLYIALLGFDELFFKAWRVSGTHPSAPAREKMLASAERAWVQVQQAAKAASQ